MTRAEKSAAGNLLQSLRKTHGAGTGRKPILLACPTCHRKLSARQRRRKCPEH